MMNMPELKYDANGLVPAIIQDAENNEVLMMAYMNKTSFEKTAETGYTYFWSRSRQKYWKKGETSGHVQEVKAILYDCDKDTVLIKVIQHGPGACHTGHRSCFFTDITGKEIAQKVFSEEDVYGKK
jgi:phosphoribosyl-AMP cyclohydrolase